MKWILAGTRLSSLVLVAVTSTGLGWLPLDSAWGQYPCYDCPPSAYPYDGQWGAGQPPDGQGLGGTEQRPGTDPLSQQQQQQQPQQQQNDIDFSQNQTAPSSLDVAYSSGGTMIGRLDSNGRLNLFDSMSAVPRNRVWFSALYAHGYNTDFVWGNAPVDNLTNTLVSRFGGEVKLWQSMSVSVQGQYLAQSDSRGSFISDPAFGGISDDWSNPEIMLKQVIYGDCNFVVSGVFGVTPQLKYSGTDIRDSTTRLYPGALFFQQWTDRLFSYGGWQFGIATTSNNVNTYDWGIGTGYWLYQSCCRRDWLQRVSLQYEVFGKHVLGDRVITNYLGSYAPGLHYREGRHVIDMTAGASFYIGHGIQWSSGFSFPVTSTEVREYELISTIGYNF